MTETILCAACWAVLGIPILSWLGLFPWVLP